VSVTWDAVIVNYNGELFLDPCLRALARTQVPPARTIVVDNASTDDSIKELSGWPSAEVVQLSENTGFAGGANRGVWASDSEIVVILNPDVEVTSSFGAELGRVFARDEALGAAGAKLTYPNSQVLQHAGGNVHLPILTTSHRGEHEPDDGSFDRPADVDYVTGALMAIRRTAFDAIGGFDESYFPAYWEDVDLCYRLRDTGWSVRYEPSLQGVHHEGAGEERGNDYFTFWTRNRLRFALRHLSADQWWQEFVPAEIERLRGELSAAESEDWLVRSGGASIETLARSGGVSQLNLEPVSNPNKLLTSITAIRDLTLKSDPAPPPLGPGDGVIRRLKRVLGRFSGRIYAEELYWQQRQFNEAVVRAFEAQDRMNRELVAQLLFTLLLHGEHRARGKAEPTRTAVSQFPEDAM
jgi:O-antigen biosynthesis protein